MQSSDNFVPTIIVTGYLGSGKSTLLNRILELDDGTSYAVVVEKRNKLSIPQTSIQNKKGQITELKNGNLYCETSFEHLIISIYDLLQYKRPDYLIIEAMGVGDPVKMILAFNRSILRNYVEIHVMLGLADAEHLSLMTTPDRVIRQQLQLSNVVLLNKTDLVDTAGLGNAKNIVEEIVPDAEMIESNYTEFDSGRVFGRQLYSPQTAFDRSGPGIHLHSVDDLPNHQHGDLSIVLSHADWESSEQISIKCLRDVLQDTPETIFRVKGVLYTIEQPDYKWNFQMVSRRVQMWRGEKWADDETPQSQLVLAGELDGGDAHMMGQLLKSCERDDEGIWDEITTQERLTWMR